MPMPLGFTHVLKRDGRAVAFDQTRIRDAIAKAIISVEPGPHSDNGGRAKAMLRADNKAERFTMEVIAELKKTVNGDRIPSIEKVQDAIEAVLHRDFGRGEKSISSEPESLWMAVMLYRQGRSLVREGLLSEQDFREKTRPYMHVHEVQKWNREHDCGSVSGLNVWFSGRRPLHELIGGCERRSEEQLAEVAESFRGRIRDGSLRTILIAGPSASGKTTTTRKAVELLRRHCPGVHFKALEADNYFRSHDHHEKFYYNVDGNPVEDINYELPDSYDVDLLNTQLEALMRGESVITPKYDFSNGVRSWNDRPVTLERDEILLIDCMHALSPTMTEAIPRESKFKLYIEGMCVLESPEGMVPWTDLRLLRRLLRDVRRRGHEIPANLWHWQLIRRGERFLLPYLFTADAIVNGGLPYEMPILKHFMEAPMKELLPIFERNPDLFDGRERARRILRLFSHLDAASDAQVAMVPKTSILREFIGGSIYFGEGIRG